MGLNGFACVTFDDGAGNILSCPGSQDGGVIGKTTWTHPIKYHMLCGEGEWTYTAVVRDGSNNGALITPKLTPIQSLYPPGCLEEKEEEEGRPTPTQSADNFGIIGFGSGKILQNEAASCSCSVSLGCQTELELNPNEPGQGYDAGKTPPEFPPDQCGGMCDFTVSPDAPIFNSDVTFTRGEHTANENLTLQFDDGSSSITNFENPVSHTFINAGVYDVKLTCSPDGVISCTRRVNVYCNNNVAPTPMPTSTPTPGPWYKLKNASFTRKTDIINFIPEVPVGYDADDTYCHETEQTNYRCLLSGEAGVSQSSSTINTNDAPISYTGWSKSDVEIPSDMSLNNYISYIKSKKQYEEITQADIIDNFVAPGT